MTKQEIMQEIEDQDVEFIRLQFTDALGNLKNIAVTPERFEKMIDTCYPFDGSAFFDDLIDYEENLYLRPDLDTFVILPWRPQQGRVGKFICDICREDGSVFEMSPRTILANVLERAKKLGYTFVVDPECEFFLFHTDENGVPTTITHERAGYLDVGPSDFGENARREIVLTLQEMGFEIEASHHEKAPAQHEISFAENEAMATADALVTFKFAVRSIAKRFGLYATFMPKPLPDAAGSGLHLDISAYRDGENVFGESGNVTDTAKHFIGGVMEHVYAMCAVTNPIVNSYKRILTGFQAPRSINWGTKGEKHLIKAHQTAEGTKVELRFPDPSANPYLAIALCIAAGLDGMEKENCPEQINGKMLPCNLMEAVCAFEDSSWISDNLGADFVKAYADIRKTEWNDYMSQVSDWEINRYLIKM